MQTTRLCVSARVEHRLHVLALPAGEAEIGDRRRRVAAAASRHRPGSLQARATTRAPLRGPDLGLVGLDDRVDRRRIDQPLGDQDRLQRAHPRRHRVEFIVVLVIVVVVSHDGIVGMA